MMNNAQLATASLDDIVFDGRNRHYGAYELRALYQRHMTRALIIATAMLALLLVFPLLAQLLKEDVVEVQTHPFTADPIAPPLDPKVLPPPPIAPPVAPPAQPIHVATIRFTPPVVAPDDRVTEEVPEQQALATATVAAVTTEGVTAVDIAPLEEVERPAATDGVVDTKIYVSVEQMPELPGGGGQAAIVAAIQKSVRYPAKALQNGVEGKVFVSFTVDPKGDVTDVKVVRGLGSGLDEETMRAIKTLPKFIPGKQNGREVSVSFTVPVTYRIQ
ncbi:energy transducer TonB [Hymenobacter segetis]|uniref:Energy transducer TonB n=1 Tax=Hymenobacter segetis TaxID=2025509 RepID=A0ABU9LRX5_9BACT